MSSIQWVSWLSWILWTMNLFEHVNSDSLNPRRPKTEADFNKINHHERSEDLATALKKIEVIKSRRKWLPWDVKNPKVQKALMVQGAAVDRSKITWTGNNSKSKSSEQQGSGVFAALSSLLGTTSSSTSTTSTTSTSSTSSSTKVSPPNILFLLADDLGYGDLSVSPFVTTPHSIDPFVAQHVPCTEGGILTPNLERMAAKGMTWSNFHSASPVCSPSRSCLPILSSNLPTYPIFYSAQLHQC